MSDAPETFAFTAENKATADAVIAKYPEGRQRSAVMPLLDIAQRQCGGWLPMPAIEYVADYLQMPAIRVLEVASFYTMYNLKPVGKHFVQVCTNLPCWLNGSDNIMRACQKKLGINSGETTEDGEFRADLFYRLNVYPIEIPPLKERREDIPLLFNVFVERYGQKASKSLAGITRRALDAMWHYDWPGNVRELENLVERAVILVDDNMPIDIPHLFDGGENIETASLGLSSSGRLQQSDKKVLSTDADEEALIDNLLEQGVCVEDIEQKMIEQAMRRTDGNVSAAARLLKMGRGKLQYKLTKQPE